MFGMEHPVLDRVRRCSAHPERAAAFFGKLLWPWERSRSSAGDALQEFYLRDTRQEMQRIANRLAKRQVQELQYCKMLLPTPCLCRMNPTAYTRF